MPGRVLQPRIDALPARHESDVDLLHTLARDQPETGVAGRGDQVETALIHERHHLVGSTGGLDAYLAAALLLEIRHPVEVRIGLAALDVTGPGDDVDHAFPRPDLVERGGAGRGRRE